jgi:hypothetical protein
MTDKARSYVRTLWPVLIGHLAAWLADRLGVLGVDSTTAALLVGSIATMLVYGLGRELERVKRPDRIGTFARAVGRLLLSVGVDTGQPIYAGPVHRAASAPRVR